MKTLNQYILESEESDNLLWLLDRWFEMHDEERQEFMNIIFQCQNDHTVNNLEKYLEQTQYLSKNYKEFITFMSDEVNLQKDINYIYQLKEIIKQLIGNKSNKNLYIKNPNKLNENLVISKNITSGKNKLNKIFNSINELINTLNIYFGDELKEEIEVVNKIKISMETSSYSRIHVKNYFVINKKPEFVSFKKLCSICGGEYNNKLILQGIYGDGKKQLHEYKYGYALVENPYEFGKDNFLEWIKHKSDLYGLLNFFNIKEPNLG